MPIGDAETINTAVREDSCHMCVIYMDGEPICVVFAHQDPEVYISSIVLHRYPV